ncbi:MAG: hypothetical protein KKB59_19585 [Spirochaetes bacterium]|nr:hypothetical protein [Spirochaetota bacterium]
MNEVINQEKSNDNLRAMANCIIEDLKDYNEVEKYKIISSLYHSLLDTLKEQGIIVEELK